MCRKRYDWKGMCLLLLGLRTFQRMLGSCSPINSLLEKEFEKKHRWTSFEIQSRKQKKLHATCETAHPIEAQAHRSSLLFSSVLNGHIATKCPMRNVFQVRCK